MFLLQQRKRKMKTTRADISCAIWSSSNPYYVDPHPRSLRHANTGIPTNYANFGMQHSCLRNRCEVDFHLLEKCERINQMRCAIDFFSMTKCSASSTNISILHSISNAHLLRALASGIEFTWCIIYILLANWDKIIKFEWMLRFLLRPRKMLGPLCTCFAIVYDSWLRFYVFIQKDKFCWNCVVKTMVIVSAVCFLW